MADNSRIVSQISGNLSVAQQRDRFRASECFWLSSPFALAPVVDHTRVVLHDVDANVVGSDYINANHISVSTHRAQIFELFKQMLRRPSAY